VRNKKIYLKSKIINHIEMDECKMEFPEIDVSTITEYKSKKSQYYRTSIKEFLVTEYNLEDELEKNKTNLSNKPFYSFYSYKIFNCEGKLILSTSRLTRDEIIELNKFFKTNEMVQFYDRLRVYVNKPRKSYALSLVPVVMKYLEAKRFLHWAELKVKDKIYLIIQGGMKIRLDL